MKLHYLAPIAALALLPVAATAQTSTETKVSTDTKDGTTKTKVVHVRKHRSRHQRKILGVKVGHKTVTHKTVHETTMGPNGSSSTTTKSN